MHAKNECTMFLYTQRGDWQPLWIYEHIVYFCNSSFYGGNNMQGLTCL